MKYKNLKKICGYILIYLALAIPNYSCFTEEMKLTIVHTNDTYGRLLAFDKDGMEFGGATRRAYVIRKIIDENPENTIVLDAGDALGPYSLSAFDKGKTAVQIMNEIGYTAMTLGNHDFDYGVNTLRERINEAKFTVLSANIFTKDDGKLLGQGYTILDKSGIKIGIIGLTTPTARYRVAPQVQKEVTFSDPHPMLKTILQDLKAKGCDFIIVLSHLGYQSDMELSSQIEGINLIVGGEMRSDDEKLITSFLPVNLTNGATLVYCPWFGGYVGRVDVFLEKKNNEKIMVKDIEVKKYRLDSETYPEETISKFVPKIKNMVDQLQKDYQDKYHGILGQTAKGKEINSLELIPLIIRKITKAEIVLLNYGSLKKEIFRGDIKRIQVIESVPYPNQIMILELSGAQLKNALAHSNIQTNENRKLIFSGIESNGTTVNGRPINPDEYYKVATNDFLAYGGDGYDMIASGRKKKNTGLKIQELLVKYIESSDTEISVENIKSLLPKYVIKSKVDLGLVVEGFTVSQNVEKYSQVSLLQSKSIGDFLYWNLNNGISTFMSSPEYYLEFGLLSKYGRLQHPNMDSVEINDSIQGSIIFKLLPGKWVFDPLTRFEIENIEFSASDDGHITTQLSLGAEKMVFPNIKSSIGILWRRHQPEKITQNQLNFDFRTSYQVKIKDISIESELKFFPVFIDSAESSLFSNYITSFVGTIKLPLNKYIYLSTNAVIYRETQIDTWAHKFMISMQVRYAIGKKS